MQSLVDGFSAAWDLINKGGVIVVLVFTVVALWKGWVVRSTEYNKVVKQNERLLEDNELLREALSSVTHGLVHPMRQTLEAIPLAPEDKP